METEEGEDSSSSYNSAAENKQILQASLLKIDQCAKQFEKGLEILLTLKRNDELQEKAIADFLEECKELFSNRVLELNMWIERLQVRESVLGKSDDDVEEKAEIKATFEMLIERFRRKVQIYKEAEEAERKRREEQVQRIDSSVGEMISHLLKAAQKAALLQINQCAEKFGEGLEVMMALERNDVQQEKAIAGSMEKCRGKFNNHVSELTYWIGKLQCGEAILGELDGPVEENTEIGAAIKRLIESLKRKVLKYKEAEEAEMKRRKQQMEWIDTSVNAMISQLSNAAQKASETDEE